MQDEKSLLKEINEARSSSKNIDRFIEKYTPFIRSEVMRYAQIGEYVEKNDELSIAMFAFYEALMNYDKSKGAFFPLAKLYIRNRLIDYFRQGMDNNLSLDDKIYDDSKTTLLDTIEDEKATIEYIQTRECTKDEIEEFQENLSQYNLTLSEIADNAPRQKRTIDVCLKALEYAKHHPDILDNLINTKKLPLATLVKEGGFDRKTLERHRKYLVGIFLAFTNGYVIIRGHLCQMQGDDL